MAGGKEGSVIEDDIVRAGGECVGLSRMLRR
jgi:hypothetical protein